MAHPLSKAALPPCFVLSKNEVFVGVVGLLPTGVGAPVGPIGVVILKDGGER